MSSDKIKNAASLLIKGGTLTNEPCKKCHGVVVRFERKTVCADCGLESEITPTDQKLVGPTPVPQENGNFGSVVAMLHKKISGLATELSTEDDLSIQKQKAELLESYLRILEKIRSMGP